LAGHFWEVIDLVVRGKSVCVKWSPNSNAATVHTALIQLLPVSTLSAKQILADVATTFL
jgi:hypothetical protein